MLLQVSKFWCYWCAHWRCQFLLPVLINLQLEHDANESLTAAPPTQLVNFSDLAGDSVCTPPWPQWLECTKSTSAFGQSSGTGQSKVLCFPRTEISLHKHPFLQTLAVPLEALLVLPKLKTRSPSFFRTSSNVRLPGQFVQLNSPAVQ